jgi:hypothetical protein
MGISTNKVRNFPSFMEPQGSLKWSEGPIADPYPEPGESSPHLPTVYP